MHIPYVIDNIEYRLADVLNALLQRERGQQISRLMLPPPISAFAASSRFVVPYRRCGASACYWAINRKKAKTLDCVRMQRRTCGMNSTPSHSPKPPCGWLKN